MSLIKNATSAAGLLAVALFVYGTAQPATAGPKGWTLVVACGTVFVLRLRARNRFRLAVERACREATENAR